MSTKSNVELNVSFAERLVRNKIDKTLLIGYEQECYYKAFQEYCYESKILLGRVLTIVDSSLPQGPQNKAAKDLIKHQFHQQYAQLSRTLASGALDSSLEEIL